jgi:hypothetical protein
MLAAQVVQAAQAVVEQVAPELIRPELLGLQILVEVEVVEAGLNLLHLVLAAQAAQASSS